MASPKLNTSSINKPGQPNCNQSLDLGKQIRNTIFAASGLFILSLVIALLVFSNNRPYLSDTSFFNKIQWGLGWISFSGAFGYAVYKTPFRVILKFFLIISPIILSFIIEYFWNINLWLLSLSIPILGRIIIPKKWKDERLTKPLVALYVAFLFTGGVLLLFNIIFNNIPIWFGTKTKQEFEIISENQNEQIWKTTSDIERVLILGIPTNKRRYHGIGTRQNIFVYALPNGIVGMTKTESSEFNFYQFVGE